MLKDFLKDPYIYKIALWAKVVDSLFEEERELEPDYPIYGTYCYIAKKGDDLFLFSSNIFNRTVDDVKRIGKLDKIYRCDLVKRGY